MLAIGYLQNLRLACHTIRARRYWEQRRTNISLTRSTDQRPRTQKMSRRTTTRRTLNLFAALAVLVCASAIAASRAFADEAALKIKRTVKLDAVGNAEIRLQVTAPT